MLSAHTERSRVIAAIAAIVIQPTLRASLLHLCHCLQTAPPPPAVKTDDWPPQLPAAPPAAAPQEGSSTQDTSSSTAGGGPHTAELTTAAAAAAGGATAVLDPTTSRRLLVILHGKRVDDELVREAIQELKEQGHQVRIWCGSAVWTVQYSAVHHNALCGTTVPQIAVTAECNAMPHNALQRSAVQYSTVQCSTVAVQCSAPHCTSVKYIAAINFLSTRV